jgi:hypothetical protein
MDQVYLLALVVAIAIVMVAVARIMTRTATPTRQAASESPIAMSTEGMTVCQKCGMGNLWTERRCSSCGANLAG